MTCVRRRRHAVRMTNLRTISKFFALILVLEIALIAIALAVAPRDAEAHYLPPGLCQNVWNHAPPGHKWEQKAKCLRYVKRHKAMHLCQPSRPIPAYGLRVKGYPADAEQRRVLTTYVNIVRHRKAGNKIAVAGIAATTQEAEARELTYGDGSSLGPFQLISSHGTPEQRISVEFSGNWFVTGALQEDYPGLSIGDLAQAVEASAYPTLYAQWVPEARRSLKTIMGPCLYWRG